jgi:hypothetical protein
MTATTVAPADASPSTLKPGEGFALYRYVESHRVRFNTAAFVPFFHLRLVDGPHATVEDACARIEAHAADAPAYALTVLPYMGDPWAAHRDAPLSELMVDDGGLDRLAGQPLPTAGGSR